MKLNSLNNIENTTLNINNSLVKFKEGNGSIIIKYFKFKKLNCKKTKLILKIIKTLLQICKKDVYVKLRKRKDLFFVLLSTFKFMLKVSKTKEWSKQLKEPKNEYLKVKSDNKLNKAILVVNYIFLIFS